MSMAALACGGGSSGGGSATDYTPDWVGSYSGTGDLYNAVNGITDTGIPVQLDVVRTDTNMLKLSLSYEWDGITYYAFITDMVDSENQMRAQGQMGALREIMNLDRSGGQIAGTYHQEDQISSGNFELIRTITFVAAR